MYPWFTQIKFMCTHCFFAGPLRELVHWMSKRAMTLKSCITEIARGTPPTPLPVIPAFRRLREEDHEIKTDLSHTATLYQRKKNQELNVTVILVLGRHRQEEYTFKASLHYIMNPGQPGLYKETLKTEGLGYSSVVEHLSSLGLSLSPARGF